MRGNDDDHSDDYDDDHAIKDVRATPKPESSPHGHKDLGRCAAEESLESQRSDRTETRTGHEDRARLSQHIHRSKSSLYIGRDVLRIRHIDAGSGDEQAYSKSISPCPSRRTDTSPIHWPAANEDHTEDSIKPIGAASIQIEPSANNPDAALNEYMHQLQLLLRRKRPFTVKRGAAEPSDGPHKRNRSSRANI